MPFHKSVLATALALASAPVVAVPFSPIDARSLSMGGAGVANARAAAAGLFNPALLATQDSEADFSIVLPSVGVILDDKDNLVETVDDVQNGSLARTEDAISSVNASGGAASGNTAAVQELSRSAAALARDLPLLGSKPVSVDVGAGFGFGIPGRRLGFGLHVATNLSAGIQADITGADPLLLNELAAEAADGSLAGIDPKFVDAGGNVKELDDLLGSTLTVVGVVMSEVGISLGREFTFGGQTVALGVTPKLLMVDTIHYRSTLNSEEELGDVVDDARYRREYTDFNLDIGMAKTFGEEARKLTVGLVVKNLITQSYQTAPDATGRAYAVSIEPQVRVGVARRWGMVNVAADLDITRNQSVGLGEDSQFLGLGAEFDARYVQLRLGYRHNLVADGIQDMATAGIGLGPLDVTALYADENSLGVNVQLGFSF